MQGKLSHEIERWLKTCILCFITRLVLDWLSDSDKYVDGIFIMEDNLLLFYVWKPSTNFEFWIWFIGPFFVTSASTSFHVWKKEGANNNKIIFFLSLSLPFLGPYFFKTMALTRDCIYMDDGVKTPEIWNREDTDNPTKYQLGNQK